MMTQTLNETEEIIKRMTRTEKFFYQILTEIKLEIQALKERDVENNIDEVSLTKAAKLVRRSPDVLLKAHNDTELSFMSYKSNGKIHYRVRVCDLYSWQKERQKEKLGVTRTTEDLAREIFHSSKRKK